VAATVLGYGGDEDLAIAGLLHDSVEDQGGKARLDDVRNRFGEGVARIVEGCCDRSP
jgi:(p)ppGpp synthase/HD superfamily hydrolase